MSAATIKQLHQDNSKWLDYCHGIKVRAGDHNLQNMICGAQLRWCPYQHHVRFVWIEHQIVDGEPPFDRLATGLVYLCCNLSIVDITQVFFLSYDVHRVVAFLLHYRLHFVLLHYFWNVKWINITINKVELPKFNTSIIGKRDNPVCSASIYAPVRQLTWVQGRIISNLSQQSKNGVS